jgi:DNA/RNA-binding domain of Phe-tRNA-synthetase-like protein
VAASRQEGTTVTTFVVEPSSWELFPEAEIGVLVLADVDNTDAGNAETRDRIVADLERANELAQRHLTAPQLSQNAEIAVWRDAFQRFKTKKGARSSIEALLKRIDRGQGVGPINPLVDIYNAISLEFALPCGVEDVDTFAGDLRLAVTDGGNAFQALGDAEPSETLPGEVAYLDDAGAVCRCWNWRDGQRTMLTEHTTRAVAIIESVDASRHDDVAAALDSLADRAESLMGARVVRRAILTRETPSISLDATAAPHEVTA